MTFRCAENSLEHGEPLPASAPFTPRWELVERDKPWGRDHGLTAENAKVLLVKRAGSAPAAPDGARKYLVCTNGARDPCCAIRGPAVAAAIERARPGQAWECSHVGGHRFAANVLVVPDNLSFARLDVPAALALVEALDAGRLPLEHFRGRTSLTPEQQAAEILLRRELGVVELDGVRHVEGTTFAVADERTAIVVVRSEELPPVRQSCRDDKVEPPLRWELVNLVFA